MESRRFCTGCGTAIDGGESFCWECGQRNDPITDKPAPTDNATEIYIPTKVETHTPEEEAVHAPAEVESHTPAEAEVHTPVEAEVHTPVEVETHTPVAVEAYAPAKVESKPAIGSFCSECGAALEDDDVFCPECGFSLAKNGGKPIIIPDDEDKKSFKLPLRPKFIAIGASAIVLIVAAILVITHLVGGRTEDNFIMFLRDNEIFLTDARDLETVAITERLLDRHEDWGDGEPIFYLPAFICQNDRFLFYFDRVDTRDGTASVFWRDLRADNSDADAATRVDRNIIFERAFLTPDGNKFFYMRDDGRLMVYDRIAGQTVRLADDVGQFWVNDEGTYMIFDMWDAGERMLFEMTLDGTEGQRNRIAVGVSNVSVVIEYNAVFYTIDGDLFLNVHGRDRLRIGRDVGRIVSNVGISQVYFTRIEEATRLLSDLIFDDLALPGTSLPAQVDLWDLDSLREALRSQENAVTYFRTDLYFWAEDESALVASDIGRSQRQSPWDANIVASSSDVPIVVFRQFEDRDTGRGVPLSEVDLWWSWGVSDFVQMLRQDIIWHLFDEQLLSEELYVAYATDVSTMRSEDPRLGGIFIHPDGRVYFLDDFNRGAGNLMSATITEGARVTLERIDTDVSHFRFDAFGERMFYFKDVSDTRGTGDLYVDGSRIARDVEVHGFTVSFRESDAIVFTTDFIERDQSFTLNIFENGEITRIADDVVIAMPISINDVQIAFLTDYNWNRSRGDLMFFDGSERPVRIETDVTALLFSPSIQREMGRMW